MEKEKVMNQEEKNKELFSAVTRGNICLVKLALQNGADVNAEDIHHDTPLHFSVWLKDIEIIKYLLDNDANVNAEDDESHTPLSIAKINSWQSILTLLEEHEFN